VLKLPMNPRTGHHYISLLDKSEADVNSDFAPGVHEKPNTVPLSAEIEDTLQPTQSPYRVVSTGRSAKLLFSILIANCVCSAFICICLWCFSTIKDLSVWEKRGFNTLSLLLSATLGFGIGFLFDQIGLLARGTLLQSKSHAVEGVCASISLLLRSSIFMCSH